MPLVHTTGPPMKWLPWWRPTDHNPDAQYLSFNRAPPPPRNPHPTGTECAQKSARQLTDIYEPYEPCRSCNHHGCAPGSWCDLCRLTEIILKEKGTEQT